MRFSIRLLPLLLLTASLAPVVAGGFEDDVRARWRGAWIVLAVEVYSDCDSIYQNNKVSGSRITSNADLRFEPGELAKIEKLQVKRSRVELMLKLDVQRLMAHRDGPFTLYGEATCKVELLVPVPRDTIKRRDLDAVDEILETVVTRFESRQAAIESNDWNGREVEPYPADYELTLARHAAWKTEQFNAAIDGMLEEAMEDAVRVANHIEHEPEYLQGFSRGAETMRDSLSTRCDRLVEGSFGRSRKTPPKEYRESDEHQDWREGFEDGQLLVYSLAILRHLGGCYAPVPQNGAGHE